jgi:ribosomal protein S12 methylthiotransferase
MRVALITLGCPKNLVDAELMLGLLHAAGHELVGEIEGADVAVVNTCAFISSAIEESSEVIDECVGLKRRGLLSRIVVAGCLPERFRESTFASFPDVDAVVGCCARVRLASVLERVARGDRVTLLDRAPEEESAGAPRILATPPHLAYVKISEGCDNHCAYCTIPSIRGPLRSRRREEIRDEVRRLVEGGVREISLIAQDTTAYGTDIASRSGLVELLEDLSATGVPWIRLLYAHPAHVSDELLRAMAGLPNVVPYLDVPVQHVCDRILAEMGRGQTGAAVVRLLERVRATIPGVTVRSSVMVGFPGETEKEFAELLGFARSGMVDYLGVFEFSPERGTRAAELPGLVPEDVASRRAGLLVSAMEEMAAARGRGALGTTPVVLVDDETGGRTAGQAWEIDGRVLWTAGGRPGPRPGSFRPVRIVGASGFDLVAEPLPDPGDPGETA